MLSLKVNVGVGPRHGTGASTSCYQVDGCHWPVLPCPEKQRRLPSIGRIQKDNNFLDCWSSITAHCKSGICRVWLGWLCKQVWGPDWVSGIYTIASWSKWSQSVLHQKWTRIMIQKHEHIQFHPEIIYIYIEMITKIIGYRLSPFLSVYNHIYLKYFWCPTSMITLTGTSF